MVRKNNRFSEEVRERAVRMVFAAKDEYDSQWAAIESIAEKIGAVRRRRFEDGSGRRRRITGTAKVSLTTKRNEYRI